MIDQAKLQEAVEFNTTTERGLYERPETEEVAGVEASLRMSSDGAFNVSVEYYSSADDDYWPNESIEVPFDVLEAIYHAAKAKIEAYQREGGA
jgi:hypothetical protein